MRDKLGGKAVLSNGPVSGVQYIARYCGKNLSTGGSKTVVNLCLGLQMKSVLHYVILMGSSGDRQRLESPPLYAVILF